MDSNEKTFYVNPKKVWKHFLGFGICLLAFIMFAWGLLFSKGPFIINLIVIVFALLCLFYSCYIMLFLATTKLIMSDRGISYQQPMYSVSAEWKYVRVMYIKDYIYLAINEEFAQIHIGTIERIFINQQNTWLNYFVDRFDKSDYWQVDPVLLELQKHIPYLTDAAREEFSK